MILSTSIPHMTKRDSRMPPSLGQGGGEPLVEFDQVLGRLAAGAIHFFRLTRRSLL